MSSSEKKENPLKSIFRQKIDDEKYAHDSKLNTELDSFGIKLVKWVGLVGVILGLLILIAFWVWVIRWLYQVW